MTFTGREIQALLGGILLHDHVPFVESVKVALASWQLMLDGTADVMVTAAEARVIVIVLTACLPELRTDGDLSPFAGPRVGLEAFRSAHSKMKQLANAAP
jgi:hypothetical protein